jgi:8-oxo-dGTP diphosphatase
MEMPEEFDVKEELRKKLALENNMKKTVAALIVADNKICLVHRNKSPFKGTWVLPGGHIHEGENDEDALIREVKEETGLTVKPKYFGSYDESFSKEEWRALVSVFTTTVQGKKDVKVGDKDEVDDVQWYAFDELEHMKIGFDHKRIIGEYLSEH